MVRLPHSLFFFIFSPVLRHSQPFSSLCTYHHFPLSQISFTISLSLFFSQVLKHYHFSLHRLHTLTFLLLSTIAFPSSIFLLLLYLRLVLLTHSTLLLLSLSLFPSSILSTVFVLSSLYFSFLSVLSILHYPVLITIFPPSLPPFYRLSSYSSPSYRSFPSSVIHIISSSLLSFSLFPLAPRHYLFPFLLLSLPPLTHSSHYIPFIPPSYVWFLKIVRKSFYQLDSSSPKFSRA